MQAAFDFQLGGAAGSKFSFYVKILVCYTNSSCMVALSLGEVMPDCESQWHLSSLADAFFIK